MSAPQGDAELDALVLRVLNRSKKPLCLLDIWRRVNSHDPQVVVRDSISRLVYQGRLRCNDDAYPYNTYEIASVLDRLTAL